MNRFSKDIDTIDNMLAGSTSFTRPSRVNYAELLFCQIPSARYSAPLPVLLELLSWFQSSSHGSLLLFPLYWSFMPWPLHSIVQVPERRKCVVRNIGLWYIFLEMFPEARCYLAVVFVLPFLRILVRDCNHSRVQGRKSILEREPRLGWHRE